MTDWTAGYVADIGYTFGYYPELNPIKARLAFLNKGLAAPQFNTACELGFGQGLSVSIHAAAGSSEWSGTDFNPSQAGFAQELVEASASGARLYDDAFAEFLNRTDLPDFDYIGLHGIWSWISDENRHTVIEFIRRKLRTGGVLYISYNTLPGWAAFAPMRHLMAEHAATIGSEGHGIISRINGALEFSEKLLATSPAFALANPQVSERIKNIKEQNRQYLAHEYFNRDWHPMHFATMAQWLEPAKLQFACSASYLDHIDALNLSAEQQSFLKTIPDDMFRESTRDFMVNQQFRRDYWVKGARRLDGFEKVERIRAIRVMLVTAREDVSLKVSGALPASLNEDVYVPILDYLADYRPRTMEEIEQAMSARKLSFAQILQAVMVLTGRGDLAEVQVESCISRARVHSDKLNAHIISKARGSHDISHLASPVTGAGVSVTRFQQLFLLAINQGKKSPPEWAAFAWMILAAQGQKVLKDGNVLETEDANMAELTAQAHEFLTKRLPVLKALQIL